jgi:Mg2+-importing ATPase
VLIALGSTPDGLSTAEAADRLRSVGPNAVRTHRARPLAVLARQLKSALLILLLTTASISFFLGERTDAAIIGVIVAASVGLGFANEYRAERAAEALHTQVKHHVAVLRDAHVSDVDVVDLVPGDSTRTA